MNCCQSQERQRLQSKCKNINYLLKLKHLVVTGTESQSPQINIQNINNTIQKHLAHKEPDTVTNFQGRQAMKVRPETAQTSTLKKLMILLNDQTYLIAYIRKEHNLFERLTITFKR